MVRAVGADPWDLVHMLNTVSAFGAMNADDERVLPVAREAVRLGRELGNMFVLVGALYGLSRALVRTDVEGARAGSRGESRRSRSAAKSSTHAQHRRVSPRTCERVPATRSAPSKPCRTAFLYLAEVGDRPQFVGAVTYAIRILGRSGEDEVAATLLGVAVDGPLAALNNFPDSRLEDSDPLIATIHRELGDADWAALPQSRRGDDVRRGRRLHDRRARPHACAAGLAAEPDAPT